MIQSFSVFHFPDVLCRALDYDRRGQIQYNQNHTETKGVKFAQSVSDEITQLRTHYDFGREQGRYVKRNELLHNREDNWKIRIPRFQVVPSKRKKCSYAMPRTSGTNYLAYRMNCNYHSPIHCSTLVITGLKTKKWLFDHDRR